MRPGPHRAAPLRPPGVPGEFGQDLFSDLILWGAALLVGTGVLVHLGAWLARVFTGTDRFEPAVGDTAVAVLSLPRHAGHPELAWPAEVRPDLPGPVAFWACLAVVLAGFLCVALLAWRGWRVLDRATGDPLGVKSEAGFARGRDLKALAVPGPTVGRLTLGRAGGRLLAAEPQASVAVIGPTGCGKTAGLAIPALLEWEGPVIAISVKADLLAATAAHRRQAGTVWVYDPTRCAGRETSSWSPLPACTQWDGAVRVAAWLTEAAQPRLDSVTDGDYWYTQARKGLAPYLYAAAISQRSIRDVVRWVDSQERNEVEEALRADRRPDSAVAQALASEEVLSRRERYRESVYQATLAASRNLLREDGAGSMYADQPVHAWPADKQDELDERVEMELDAKIRAELDPGLITPLVAARSLWGKDQRLRDSVFATMENVLTGYTDPKVADTAESCEIDLAEWLSGNHTIYVVATSHEQARLRPVLTVLVQQAIRAAYDTASARPDGRLAHPCLVLLDEAGNTAPLRDLPSYAATARSHGVTLVSVWQDLAQVRSIYRERAQTVLNNHRAKLFGTGIADEATLEYVSRLIGDERRTEHTLSGDLTGGRRNVSEHTTYRRAAPLDVLRRIRPDEAVVVYGSELPAHVRLRPYYRDPELRRRARLPESRRRWSAVHHLRRR
jgi:type IV secretion system protein VirD4